MMRAARGAELKYLVRTLIRNMRIGANQVSVLHALAAAAEEHHRDRAAGAMSEKPDAAASAGAVAAAAAAAAAAAVAAAAVAAGAAAAAPSTRGVTAAMAAVGRAYSLCPSLDVLVRRFEPLPSYQFTSSHLSTINSPFSAPIDRRCPR